MDALHVGQREVRPGLARERRAVESPLVTQRCRSRDRHTETGQRARDIRPALRLRRDAGQSQDGQGGHHTGYAARHVSYYDGVIAGVGGLDIGNRIARSGRTAQRCPVKPPLIGQGRCPGGGDAEAGRCTGDIRSALRLGRDAGGGPDGERGDYARHTARYVGYHHGIVAGVDALHVGQREVRPGLAGERCAVESPLVTQRCCSRGCHTEAGRSARDIRPALRLAGDRWRHPHRQHRHDAGHTARHVSHYDGVIAGVDSLDVGNRIARSGRTPNRCAVKLPLVGQGRGPGGGDAEAGRRAGDIGPALRLGRERGRHPHRQHRHGAGHTAQKIGYHHVIVAGVGALHVGQGDTRPGLAGKRRAVEPPLVTQRRRSRGRHTEAGRRARDIRPALRLAGDHRRRPNQRQAVFTSHRNGHHIRQPSRHEDSEAPGRHRAVGAQGQAAVYPRRDGHHIAQPSRHSRRAQAIVAPRGHRAVGAQGQVVAISARNGHQIAQPSRHIRQDAPRGHRAVDTQGQAVVISRRNGHHIAQPSRHICLTVVVPSPGGHRAVGAQGQAVVSSRRNGHHIGQPNRLATVVVAPRGHRAVGAQGHAVVISSGNGHHIGQPSRHSRLAVIVVAKVFAPRGHRAVGAQGQAVVSSPRKGHYIGQPRRHSRLACGVISPRGHRENCHMGHPARNRAKGIARYQPPIAAHPQLGWSKPLPGGASHRLPVVPPLIRHRPGSLHPGSNCRGGRHLIHRLLAERWRHVLHRQPCPSALHRPEGIAHPDRVGAGVRSGGLRQDQEAIGCPRNNQAIPQPLVGKPSGSLGSG